MPNNLRKTFLITNDLGPRAGGIESFVLGLLERLDANSVVILTSSQLKSKEFDQQLFEKYGAIVIRDRSKILLPTPRITHRAVQIMNQYLSLIHI